MKKQFALLTLCLVLLLSGCGVFGTETIYFWNHDPNADEAWQEIAQIYEKEEKVSIKIVSVDPQAFEQNLAQALEEGNGPAIFSCSDAGMWQDDLTDLKDTELSGQCTNWDYNYISEDGRLLAVGYSKEYTGILVNKALLKAAGYSLEDITDYASLKALAEDITARSEQLRFGAFTSGSKDAALLMVNHALYYAAGAEGQIQPEEFDEDQLENLKQLLDLYALNGNVSEAGADPENRDGAVAEFVEGKAVFLVGSSALYRKLTEAGMRPKDLAMISLYCGADGEQNQGLSTGTRHYWAVNSRASEKEIRLALEFLNWVASSDEGLRILRAQYGDVPFQNAVTTENVFCMDAQKLEREGKSPFFWVYDRIAAEESWMEELVLAIQAYCSTPGETEWAAIVDVFAEK